MIIGLTGATGFLGRRVLSVANARGHEVIAFSRDPLREIPQAIETRKFSLTAPPDLQGCDAVVHLAGEPILGWWTPAKKRRIQESRIEGTRRIAEAIGRLACKPEALVCASAIGLYAPGETEAREEAPHGSNFLAETVEAWEREAQAAPTGRVTLLRTGVALGSDGGALALMRKVFRLGLGGTLGDGRQWMSWIHGDDYARLAMFAVENMDIRGPLNACAPWPVRHREFVQTLARLLHRPAIFRVPAFLIRSALRGLAAEVLDSKRVVPAAAIRHGFGFQFPQLESALRDLLN